MRCLLRFIPLLLLVLIACEPSIQGNGVITEQVHDLPDFNKVRVDGMFQVELIKGSPELQVLIDDNLHQYVTYHVEDEVLKIGTSNKLLDADSAVLRIYFETISAIGITGASQIRSSHSFKESLSINVSGAADIELFLDNKQTTLELNGGGDVTLSGKSTALGVAISGAANIDAKDLETSHTNIQITGAGDCEVWATKQLKVTITGAGEVKYKGSPEVNKNITGAGEVSQMDTKAM